MDSERLTHAQASEILEMAWADEVSFDAIRSATGMTEKQVILLMRSHMKPSSFRMWRKRVSGRKSKHEKPRTRDLLDSGWFVRPPSFRSAMPHCSEDLGNKPRADVISISD